jgi:hypothetical protein
MEAISASVGKRLVGLSVQMLMKRMSILLGWCFAVTAILSNGTEANRHETEILFGANYNRRDLHWGHDKLGAMCKTIPTYSLYGLDASSADVIVTGGARTGTGSRSSGG